MTHENITVTIQASGSQTQILVSHGSNDLLIAKLGPSSWAHRDALLRLIEGLALWFQARVDVVLYAASEEIASSTGLIDGLGCGISTLYLDIVVPRERRRGLRLRGLGELRALRRAADRGSAR